MIIPSIDLMGSQAVQLVGGETKALDAGDPIPIAERFSVAGELAVVDLDAALGTGSNRGLVEKLVQRFPCRVGGGIRDVETAVRWLDAGAAKIVIGTAAQPELLEQLPAERVVAALDARHGEVVVEGWRKGTGRGILEEVKRLKDFAGGFLITFVEREGRLQGTALDGVSEIVRAASPRRVTIAGGITTPEEVAQLDRLGADAQVGMALYTGRMDLGGCHCSALRIRSARRALCDGGERRAGGWRWAWRGPTGRACGRRCARERAYTGRGCEASGSRGERRGRSRN